MIGALLAVQAMERENARLRQENQRLRDLLWEVVTAPMERFPDAYRAARLAVEDGGGT